MQSRTLTLRRSTALLLIALISALAVAVPLLDRDLGTNECTIGTEDSGPVSGVGHDHRICVQYGSSQLALSEGARRLNLAETPTYGTYWITSLALPSPADPTSNSRAPPAI